tara:strand:- start:22634 stop:24316 length:1683 start_codon:yes stop_codon:yes gene_type:complete
MTSNTASKTSKGMKQYKKAMKEKATVKRAAAAGMAKSKKNCVIGSKAKVAKCEDFDVKDSAQHAFLPPTKITASDADVSKDGLRYDDVDHCDQIIAVQESVTVNHGPDDPGAHHCGTLEVPLSKRADILAASTKTDEPLLIPKVHANEQVTLENTEKNPTSIADPHAVQHQDISLEQIHLVDYHELAKQPAVLTQTLDIHAHRKNLETALYDNMESPKERLIRLSDIKSWEAEALHDIVNDDADSNESTTDNFTKSKCSIDDNHFETMLARDLLSAEISPNPTVNTSVDTTTFETLHDISQDKFDDTPGAQLLSVDKLFAAAAASGAPVVRLPGLAGDTSVVLPAAAGDKATRVARALTCIEAGITFGQLHQNPEPFIDPAILTFAVREQEVATAQPSTTSCTQEHDPCLAAALDRGSQKLKAVLGIGSPTSPTSSTCTLEEGAEMLKSLLGIGRSRTASLESSNQHSRISSPPQDAGPQTPFTHYSASPPTNHIQCDFDFMGYSNGPCPPWFPSTVDGYYAPLYSHIYPGFGAAPFMTDFHRGRQDYACGWQPMGYTHY